MYLMLVTIIRIVFFKNLDFEDEVPMYFLNAEMFSNVLMMIGHSIRIRKSFPKTSQS